MLSLAICIAAVCLWGRSYWVLDEFSFTAERGYHLGFVASRGDFLFFHSPAKVYANSRDHGDGKLYHRALAPFPIDPANLPQLWGMKTFGGLGGIGLPTAAFLRSTWQNYHFAGFAYQIHWDWTNDRRGNYLLTTNIYSRLLLVPAWFVCLVTATLPAWWLWWLYRRRRERRRRREDYCVHCGYDLRASEGRCPECGSAIPESPTKAPIKEASDPS